MADVIGSAEFELRASRRQLARDVQNAERDLKSSVQRTERDYARGGQNASRAWARGQRDMVRETRRAEGEIRASSGRISAAITAAAGALIGGVTVQAGIQLSDAYTRFANSLRVAGVEGAAFAAVQDRLSQAAIRNGADLESLGQLYGRASQAAAELGASQGDLLRFTDGVSAAIRIQGGDAASASGALLQLSQALASGTVRAEEFNSVNEGARPILEAVANGSDRFGGSVAKLREEVLNGTVTSRDFFDAFLRGSGELETRAAKAPLTVAAGYTNLRTALTLYAGESGVAKGATEALGAALTGVAENLDILIPSLAAITVGAGTAYVGGAIAAAGATTIWTTAVRGLNVALLTISRHPIIAALTVIAAGLTFVAVRGREASGSIQDLTNRINENARAAGTLAEETNRLGGDMDATAAWAANLTGEVDKLADAHWRAAAAAKAQAIETRRLRLLEATDQLNAARESFAGRQRREARIARGPIEPGSRAATAGMAAMGIDPQQVANQAVLQSPEYRALTAATRNVIIQTNELRGEMARTLETYVPARTGGGGGGGGSGAAAGAAGPTAAEMQAQAEAMAMLDRLAVAVDAVESHRLATLEAINLAMEEGERAAERRNALAAMALSDQIELARLSGDQGLLRELLREEEIRRRIVDLMRLTPGLTEEAARAQATRTADLRDAAARQGQMQDDARHAARTIVDVLRSDDIWDEAGRRFRDAAFDNLEDLFASLLSGGFGGGKGGGGGWVAAIGSALFGGGRQFGGSVSAGRAYRVGEAGAETFVPASDGYIVPNAAGSGSHQPRPIPVRVMVESNDEKLRVFVLDAASPMVQASERRAVQTSLRATSKSAPAMQSRMRRLGTP
ncbi:tape measure protein [Phenylobacterium sp.]|uniref:tape measure protein n=1 Tax=Phenylobacterium sp. TaxID=1871053 RepID=UPI0030024185